MKISVSILKSKYNEKETINKINRSSADYIHVDVMDGKFTTNKTNRYEHLHTSKKKLKVHLMVNDPFNYISLYSTLNTETIIIQSEIEEDINSLIEYIHERGLKAGIAVKPSTSIKMIEKYLDMVEEVLILSVEPGEGGQKMMESTLYKIDILNTYRKHKKYNFLISVDGGVNIDTISKVSSADIVISGSYICMSDDYDKQIESLR